MHCTKTYSQETNPTEATYPLTLEGGQGREREQNSDILSFYKESRKKKVLLLMAGTGPLRRGGGGGKGPAIYEKKLFFYFFFNFVDS